MRPEPAKRCERCGRALDVEMNPWRKRKYHPECAEKQVRDATRKANAKRNAETARRIARDGPWVRPTKASRPAPPRNPKGSEHVEMLIRRVDGGRVRSDDHEATAAFERLRAQYGEAS